MEIELTRIGKYSLKKILVCTVNFDNSDGMWCVENEELALTGYGHTIKEAVENLEESLESLIVGFKTFPDEKLHEKSIEIKKKLAHYVDF